LVIKRLMKSVIKRLIKRAIKRAIKRVILEIFKWGEYISIESSRKLFNRYTVCIRIIVIVGYIILFLFEPVCGLDPKICTESFILVLVVVVIVVGNNNDDVIVVVGVAVEVAVGVAAATLGGK